MEYEAEGRLYTKDWSDGVLLTVGGALPAPSLPVLSLSKGRRVTGIMTINILLSQRLNPSSTRFSFVRFPCGDLCQGFLGFVLPQAVFLLIEFLKGFKGFACADVAQGFANCCYDLCFDGFPFHRRERKAAYAELAFDGR
jgi:hypothetical protein